MSQNGRHFFLEEIVLCLKQFPASQNKMQITISVFILEFCDQDQLKKHTFCMSKLTGDMLTGVAELLLMLVVGSP